MGLFSLYGYFIVFSAIFANTPIFSRNSGGFAKIEPVGIVRAGTFR